MSSSVFEILSSDNTERTITALIKGVPYEFQYQGSPEEILSSTRKIMKHSSGKALLYMTRKATNVTKLIRTPA